MFGEGVNDTETLAYFSQVANDSVKSKPRVSWLWTPQRISVATISKPSERAFNFLLTGSYHAFRSACIPSYEGPSKVRARDGVLVRKQRCKSRNKDEAGWILRLKGKVDNVNSYLGLRILEIISDYLSSSLTSYQFDLYQNIVQSFIVRAWRVEKHR